MELTQERLKELLNYNPDTGIFTWKKRDIKFFNTLRACNSWNTRHAGNACGFFDPYGYKQLCIMYKKYMAHRIAFLYVNGSFPANEVDHINHIRNDNRWKNIREVTSVENHRNQSMSSLNSSGHVGVRWRHQYRKWEACITCNRKQIYLGSYITLYAACYARHAAGVRYGFHENHGKIL